MALPRIAITTGDPAGIGPEIALKAVASKPVQEVCCPLIVGDATSLLRVADSLGLPLPKTIDFAEGFHERGLQEPGCCFVTELEDVQAGRIDSATGKASFRFVDWAIRATQQGWVDGIATGPIHKEAWHLAEVPFPGHTELLTQRTGAKRVRMMLTSQEISCVLVTCHIGFSDVVKHLSEQAVFDAILLGHEAVLRFGRREARITVCGLNPHAGEKGLFGYREEERYIEPAIERARARGVAVVGPLSPDTAFTPARRSQTDAYVCMYHDQGLIPLKTLAFHESVNVTLGLPIIRTSVDHGTALEIAWQGIANPASMVAAIRLAAQLHQSRAPNKKA